MVLLSTLTKSRLGSVQMGIVTRSGIGKLVDDQVVAIALISK